MILICAAAASSALHNGARQDRYLKHRSFSLLVPPQQQFYDFFSLMCPCDCFNQHAMLNKYQAVPSIP
jgi:hypothetical protein